MILGTRATSVNRWSARCYVKGQEDLAMSRIVLTLFVLLPLFAACAGPTDSYAPSASPSSRDAYGCERDGGVWHPNLGVCEVMRR